MGDMGLLTLSWNSWLRISSMAVLARSASLRKNILTKAWRLSLLTMQVWTWPKRLKISRSSCSEQLRMHCQLPFRYERSCRSSRVLTLHRPQKASGCTP